MKVKSLRFGTVDLPDDRVVRFVRPMVGFDGLDAYALIEDPETQPVLWLQALGEPDVLFPVVDLARITDNYAVDLDEDAAEALGLERAEDSRLLGILTLSPNPADISVNLRAPVVWNTRAGTALQLVLQDSEMPVRYPVCAAPGESRSNKEVARAGTHATQG